MGQATNRMMELAMNNDDLRPVILAYQGTDEEKIEALERACVRLAQEVCRLEKMINTN